MVKVVYIDVLFTVNLIINYLLLFLSAKITGAYIKRPRLVLSAFLGAIYCVIAYFFSAKTLFTIVSKTVMSLVMVIVAFGNKQGIIRRALVFLGVSCACAGVVLIMCFVSNNTLGHMKNGIYYLNVSLKTLMVATAVSYLVISTVFKRTANEKNHRSISNLTITHRGRNITLNALLDTGNSLCDPITNAPAVIVEYQMIRSLFTDEEKSIFDSTRDEDFPFCMERLPYASSFRLLPYKTVSSQSDMLLAFRPDKITVDGKVLEGGLVGINPACISDGSSYNAIV